MPEHAHSSWRKTDLGQQSYTGTSIKHPPERNNVRERQQGAPISPAVSDLMSREIDYCTPDCSVQAVACLMADRNVGSIPVVNDTDHMIPIGIMTDRDIVTRVIAPGLDPCAVRVDQCMSLDVQTIRNNATAPEALSMMQRHHLRRLPVTDDTGCLVGILSHADLTRPANSAQNAETIRELSEPVS